MLIRDLPEDVLERIKSAAAEESVSLQNYLRNTVVAQADYLNRQEALTRAAQRLRDKPAVSPEERQAVLDAIDGEHDDRAEQLIDREEQ